MARYWSRSVIYQDGLVETAAWLAQLVERQSAVREVEGRGGFEGRSRVRAPDRTNTQGLKITEENVLPL